MSIHQRTRDKRKRQADNLQADTLTGNAAVSLPPFEEISFSLGDLWPIAAPKRGSAAE